MVKITEYNMLDNEIRTGIVQNGIFIDNDEDKGFSQEFIDFIESQPDYMLITVQDFLTGEIIYNDRN